jgi:protein MpaA
MLFMLIMFRYINSRRNLKLTVITGIFVLLALSGCSQSPYAPKLGPVRNKIVVPLQQRFAGVSVENRPIMYYVLGQGSDVTFIMSTIHGDEPAGTLLANYLADYLNENTELLIARKVVIIPVANPDGLAQKKRFNANEVDLNRNFPAENRTNDKELGPSSLSEPEAHIINELIKQYNPDRIISIHQPYGCIDYDGPAQDLAEHIAEYCDLPIKKVGAQPGSLGSYAGLTMGIPIITLELLENDSNLNAQILWQRYSKALLAAITYPQPVQ